MVSACAAVAATLHPEEGTVKLCDGDVKLQLEKNNSAYDGDVKLCVTNGAEKYFCLWCPVDTNLTENEHGPQLSFSFVGLLVTPTVEEQNMLASSSFICH